MRVSQREKRWPRWEETMLPGPCLFLCLGVIQSSERNLPATGADSLQPRGSCH